MGGANDAPAPAHRVNATVELKQAEPETGIDWPAWIQAISPILLALVGLYFTDTVRMGFERQQLQLANASGMQELDHAGRAGIPATGDRTTSTPIIHGNCQQRNAINSRNSGRA